jgi:nucleoid-associated protein YgaU
MGMFDFVKDAGAKLFGGKPPADNKETYKPLSAHVEEHGISAKDIKFRFDQGVLVVEGHVPDAVTREKVILIVGNVEGIGKVDDRLQVGKPVAAGAVTTPPATATTSGAVPAAPAAAPAPAWTSKTYTVKKGDTLSKIAKEFYGKPNEYPKIFEANKPMLKHPDKIYPGQVLRIP